MAMNLRAPEVVECANDKEAVEKAAQLAAGFDVEIWDHKRFVAKSDDLLRPVRGIAGRHAQTKRVAAPIQNAGKEGCRDRAD